MQCCLHLSLQNSYYPYLADFRRMVSLGVEQSNEPNLNGLLRRFHSLIRIFQRAFPLLSNGIHPYETHPCRITPKLPLISPGLTQVRKGFWVGL